MYVPGWLPGVLKSYSVRAVVASRHEYRENKIK